MEQVQCDPQASSSSSEWVRVGVEFGWEWAARPRPKTEPACSKKLMNVCVLQLPVCLLELCKQLWLNALETLPNDRINPPRETGFCYEELHQCSKRPFHSSQESLILFMPGQEGRQWPELRNGRKDHVGDTTSSTAIPFPALWVRCSPYPLPRRALWLCL
jgi:hypothetical protein